MISRVEGGSDAALGAGEGGATQAFDSGQRRAADALSLEALLLARAYFYTLAHKLFGGEPTDELLALALGETTADVLDEYASDIEPLASYATMLRGLRERDRRELLDELRDEYTRCFIGPASLPAIPYASPHITRNGAAVQERTLAVRACYRAHGLEPKRLSHVPDDHVSLLCAFVARLADGALQAFSEGDAAGLAERLRDQGAVVREHLTSWLEDYARAMRRSRTAVLYPQTVEALAAFAQADATFLDEAAYWLESDGDALGGLAERCGADGPGRFPSARDDYARLKAVRLYAIEDNELVPVHE